MDKIKLLEDQVSLYKSLLGKTEDEKEIKEYGDKIETLNQEIGKEKALAEVAKTEEAEKAELKEAQAKSTVEKELPTKIEVGRPEMYKGFNLNKEVHYLKTYDGLTDKMKSEFKQDEGKAERQAKMFIDLVSKAYEKPMAPFQKAAMQEDTDAEGGYLVENQPLDEYFAYVRGQSIALQNCTVVNMTSNTATAPAELTKVSVTIETAEEAAINESEPTYAQVSMTNRRHNCYAKVSNELLQDQRGYAGGIAAILMSQFNEALGQTIDSAVFQGPGSPVSGVFLSTGNSVVFSSGSTAFSELLESNMRSAIKNIRPNRRGNAKWYGSTSVLYDQVYGLQDSQNRPLYMDNRAGLGAPRMLLGYPVVEGNDDIMPSTSAADTGMLVFGDLKGFAIGKRLASVDMLVDPYSSSLTYQTQFVFVTRWAYAHALNGYYTRIVTAAS